MELKGKEQEIIDFLKTKFDCCIVSVEMKEDGVLDVDLSGDCSSCPLQNVNMDEDMLAVLQDRYPEIKRVNSRPYISDETMDMVKKMLREGWSQVLSSVEVVNLFMTE